VKESASATKTSAPAEPEPAAVSSPPTPKQFEHFTAIQAAPIVRHRAAELGINLSNVTGSGPDGRILLEDLERLPKTGQIQDKPVIIAAAESTEKILPAATAQNVTAEPLSRMRTAIAKVTTDSWRTIPHFYISIEVEMERAEKVVQGLKAEGVAVSLNALILAAVAASLVKFPGLNAALTDKGLQKYASVNLGFAVAVEDGLIVPVIKGAEKRGARELNDEAARLAAMARGGKISADEITGGTFSVSNLGMHGICSFASIIMPGQAAILAVGTVTDRPVARSGSLEIGRIMTATLSCDHRIIDGVYAADFLNEFKRLLENPTELPA
jgi:pyruvate dehydrogenase E2 component (dihydrolipoamide acetyltransferase)